MANGTFQPIPKTGVRVVDRQVLAAVEQRWCEYCGHYGRPIHRHHERTKGAGGHDSSDNVIGLCYLCHDLRHRGKIKREQIYAKLVELGRRQPES